jgi:hypothetical protein
MGQSVNAPLIVESVDDRVHLLLDSFMRRAPCSPARSQLDVDCVHRALVCLGIEHPDQGLAVVRALEALRRECTAEDLVFPGSRSLQDDQGW